MLKTLTALAAIMGASAVLVGCDDGYETDDRAPPPAEMTQAPAAEDVATPAVTESAVDQPPADASALPPETRSSEESVQPESETLFY